MKRKLLALFLASAMLLAGLPLSAAAAATSAYDDVKPDSWYAYAVEWATGENIVSGYGDGTFAPNRNVTRAELVKMLWGVDGKPAAEEGLFPDVLPEQWFAAPVNWAGANKVVSGYEDSTFRPQLNATREQVVTILYNYATFKGKDLTARGDLSGFTDAKQVADWALTPMRWAVGQGLINGTTATTLSPKSTASRAQLVSILYRWMAEYTQQDVHVYRESLQEIETVTLRYYRDEPHVATMGLMDYYNTFWHVKTSLDPMTLERDGLEYVFTASTGATARLNPVTDVMTVDDYSLFSQLPVALAPESPEDKPVPFIFGAYVTESGDPLPWVTDFTDYFIDLREDENDVFLPLDTLSNLFGGQNGYYTLFNGKAIYVEDSMGNVLENAVGQSAPDYYSFTSGTRSADLIEHSYQELLFNLEHFYGRPGSELLHAALETQTLDSYLKATYPWVYNSLHSANYVQYTAGLFALFNGLMADGGHTYFSDVDWAGETAMSVFYQLCQANGVPYQEKAMGSDVWAQTLSALRQQMLGDESYYQQGDTAFFTFDGFTLDVPGWKDYYAALRNGEEPTAKPDDTLTAFLAAVEKADADPEIKNFVVDLTTNGGGVVQIGAFMTDLMAGSNQLNEEDLTTGIWESYSYYFDRNLDNVDDEQDDAVSYDLNFAVLVSPYSFSCANTVPAMMKDAGLLILGETSGGGSCTIQDSAVIEGLVYGMSSPHRYTNNAGENLDTGVEPQVFLGEYDEDGLVVDLSGFYDLEVLSQAINSWYAEQEIADPAA